MREIDYMGMPQKLVKGEDSVFETPMGNRLGMFGEPPSEVFTSASTRNKENLNPGFAQLKPPVFQLPQKRAKRGRESIESLTPTEGRTLLETWEKNHFINFNSWLQVAKAKVLFSLIILAFNFSERESARRGFPA